MKQRGAAGQQVARGLGAGRPAMSPRSPAWRNAHLLGAILVAPSQPLLQLVPLPADTLQVLLQLPPLPDPGLRLTFQPACLLFPSPSIHLSLHTSCCSSQVERWLCCHLLG